MKRVGKRYGKEEENQFEFVYFSGNVVDSEEINTAEQTDVQVNSQFHNTAFYFLKSSNRHIMRFGDFSKSDM